MSQFGVIKLFSDPKDLQLNNDKLLRKWLHICVFHNIVDITKKINMKYIKNERVKSKMKESNVK